MKRTQPELFYAIIVAGGLFLVYLAVILFVPSGRMKVVLADWLNLALNLAATLALYVAARRSFASSRRLGVAWGIIALAQLSYTLGDAVWGVLEAVLNLSPFPSAADGFYLAYYPLFLVGVLVLPTRRFSRQEWLETFLDTSIVLAAAGLGFWNYFLGPIALASNEETWIVQALSLAYPVGDLVMLWALMVLMYGRSGVKHNRPLYLLMAGIIVMIATDCLFSYQSLQGTYETGNILDVGWSLVYISFGLAGAFQAVSTRAAQAGQPSALPAVESQEGKSTWLAYFPYAWIGLAYLLLIHRSDSDLPMSREAITLGVGIVVALVLIRQIGALAENTRLNKRLRQALNQVQQQTVELIDKNKTLQVEIADRKLAEQQLSYDALHDALTDLPNRVLFMDRLEHAITYTKRYEDDPFSVLFLDVDHFKVVNDSLGHSFGDKMLISIGRRLKACVRPSDTVARMGGDEFVLLLENTKDLESVKAIAARIQEELALPFLFDGHRLFISASIGIVASVASYANPEDVLRDADIAMYQAKSMGKARSELFDTDLRTQAINRLEMEGDLRRALENQEFQLHYQPILSLAANQIIGFEALCRWNHPTRGLLAPMDFIPIAEETGLIVSLGKWVLLESCGQMKAWQMKYAHQPPLAINVNISGKQFIQPDFVEQVEHALVTSGLSPTSLRLEITETVLIDNAKEATTVFNRLCDLGVQLQIDDFGTGYSAIGYLQHYPVHTIKIDQSFIQGIGSPGKNIDLVHTMVAMAQDLGMEAIAEGVETDAQLEELKKIGCKYAQGYLLSVPLNGPSAESWLEQVSKQGGPEF
jgi:diguanylate cyclase (GGDEF)-like protein